MQTELEHTSSISRDLEVRGTTWKASVARDFGSAEIYVPNDSPACDTDYINPDGGSLVTIRDNVLGFWQGVVLDIAGNRDGLTLQAVDIGRIFTVMPLQQNRSFPVSTSAGAIVKRAFQDTVTGVARPFIQTGTFVEALPRIEGGDYSYTADMTFADVLIDMMGRTGQEWEIRDNTFYWIGRAGNYYELLLIEETDIVDVSWSASATDRYGKVMVLQDGVVGNEITQYANEVTGTSWWPAAKTVTSTDTSSDDRILLAQQTLEQWRYPRQTRAFRLHRRHWASIREGDRIHVLLTRAAITGRTEVVRVISRTYKDGSDYLDLEVEQIPQPRPETINAASAQSTLPRSGKAITPRQQVLRSLVVPWMRRKVSSTSAREWDDVAQ